MSVLIPRRSTHIAGCTVTPAPDPTHCRRLQPRNYSLLLSIVSGCVAALLRYISIYYLDIYRYIYILRENLQRRVKCSGSETCDGHESAVEDEMNMHASADLLGSACPCLSVFGYSIVVSSCT